MNRNFLTIAAVFAALAVILGAFGAHALKASVSPEKLQVFETAVRYQFYHVFALMAAGMLFKEYPGQLLLWSGWLFIAGIVLFSGSLYALTFLPEDMKRIGIITPFGGAAFIAGWFCFAVAIISKKNNHTEF